MGQDYNNHMCLTTQKCFSKQKSLQKHSWWTKKLASLDTYRSSWWFQAIWKILVKLDHFPEVRGENKKSVKPSPIDIYIYIYMGVSKNRGGPPKSSHFNRGFPLFSPSILVVFPLFLETPIYENDLIKTYQSFPAPLSTTSLGSMTPHDANAAHVVGRIVQLRPSVKPPVADFRGERINPKIQGILEKNIIFCLGG